MSKKYCDKHDEEARAFCKKLCAFLLALLLLLFLVTIFLVGIILRPSRPRIRLQTATINYFSLSSSPPYFLNATIQVTLACRNSNDNIGILYQKLDVYAEYKSQRITLPTALPTGYQQPNDDNVWSPLLYSVNSPIAPYLAAQLVTEQQMQMMVWNVKMDGKIKWKVGGWISGVYHLYADCPAYIASGSGQALDSRCDVDVGLGG